MTKAPPPGIRWRGSVVSGARSGAGIEDRRLEAAEIGHPGKPEQVSTLGQLDMACLAGQPAMLRPVQPAVEEVVVFRPFHGLPVGPARTIRFRCQHRGCVAAGALPLVGLGADHLAHERPAALGEVPALVEHQFLR